MLYNGALQIYGRYSCIGSVFLLKVFYMLLPVRFVNRQILFFLLQTFHCLIVKLFVAVDNL